MRTLKLEQMTPDRELLRLLRQLAMSKQYHDLSQLEQEWLNVAVMEWTVSSVPQPGRPRKGAKPIDDNMRRWAYMILEKYGNRASATQNTPAAIPGWRLIANTSAG